MPFERSAEARREDNLRDRLSQVRKKSTRLDQQIKELKSELEGKEDSAHFAMTDLQIKYIVFQNLYIDFHSSVHNKKMDEAKGQINALLRSIVHLRIVSSRTLERIENNLKTVKICFW